MNTNKLPIYPCEPWQVSETEFDVSHNYRNETTFALSNGYIGTRGTFEEGYGFDTKTGLEGNFINGFYESEPIRYGEFGFGFPKMSQTMLNVTNAKTIRLFLDNEPFDMRTGSIQQYCRILYMDKGIVARDVVWTSQNGKQIQMHTERLVSFVDKHLMAIRYEVTPLNFSGTLQLESVMDCDVVNHTADTNPLIDYGPYGRVLLPESTSTDGGTLFSKSRTQNTNLTLGCMCVQVLSKKAALQTTKTEFTCAAAYTVYAAQGERISLEKYIAYAGSQDCAESELKATLSGAVSFGKNLNFAGLAKKQEEYVKSFWNMADVQVKGDDSLQQGIRFNLFHIMQSAGRDGRTGMGAKGLSGEGYEGHSFWDTEMYIMPVFSHTFPEISKKLLDYRYNTLDKARERAREMGHPLGALYPWRTINGAEASAYYPLGTAQYHINADIAYAFQQYVTVTGDYDYLSQKAAEVLCETARVWADVGSFAESKDGKYCICCVTGPDEYNALVDNNFYTNLMARENLRDAVNALHWLDKNRHDDYVKLCKKISLQTQEVALWEKIIDNMYFPHDEKLDIYPQDDGFLQRKPWNEEAIPEEKRSLLYVNYHPLFVFRHKMSKQADAILGMYLHDNLFTKEELKRNFDFYQTVTLHHSSLSTCIFGILACEIGYTDLAYEYFSQSARMDLDDYHQNFYAGIHAANMAGTWLAIVNGFAGMRTNGDNLSFHPFLPEKWNEYSFKVNYKGSVLKVTIEPVKVRYELVDGSPITFMHKNFFITLTQKGEVHDEKV